RVSSECADKVQAESQATQFMEFTSLVENLNSSRIDQKTRAARTNELFQLTKETRLLAEIMDIQDELKTIKDIFVKQKEVLDRFLHLIEEKDHHKKSADDESDVEPLERYQDPAHLEKGSVESPLDAQAERKPLPSAIHKGRGRPRVERNVQFADEQLQPKASK